MDSDGIDDEPPPTCDLCGLDLELVTVERDGHPAVSLACLVHGERQVWQPFNEE